MTLLELLRQELPKRGGWPEGAVGVVQDKHDTEFYFFIGTAPKFDGKSWWFGGSNPENQWIFHDHKNSLASDHATAIVTREQYEATGCNFRPLRTEAERAIDEIVRLSGVSIGAAKILYDAGYRKG